jgi:hypothetical protein
MSTLSPFCLLECSCDEALRQTQAQISRAGLRALQTFDLRTTRHTLEKCSCPYYGTEACNCQMVVLLVYGETMEPITLILHGNDGRTWVSFAENISHSHDNKMRSKIEEIFQAIPRK